MQARKRFTVPFIPNHILTEAAVAMVVFGALLVLSSVLPRGMEAQADKLVTPVGIKPEWYFLWAFAILEMTPSKIIGIAIPGVIFALLVAIPWLERNPHRHPAKRVLAVSIFTIAIIAIMILTYVGATVQFS